MVVLSGAVGFVVAAPSSDNQVTTQTAAQSHQESTANQTDDDQWTKTRDGRSTRESSDEQRNGSDDESSGGTPDNSTDDANRASQGHEDAAAGGHEHDKHERDEHERDEHENADASDGSQDDATDGTDQVNESKKPSPEVEFDGSKKIERRDFEGVADPSFGGDPLTWKDAEGHGHGDDGGDGAESESGHDHDVGTGGTFEDLATTNGCPTGTPVKEFDVAALDVVIPLNRFGSHDPEGRMFTLASNVDAVRAQEAIPRSNPDKVSHGLRDDAIQPLVIRANLGDCVVVTLTNSLRDEPASFHIHRGPVEPSQDGSFVGENNDSLIAPGESRTYTFYIPNDDRYEGVWYFHSHALAREQTSHGLFGALMVEHAGSTYFKPDPDPKTGELVPIESGWEAIIVDGETGVPYREYVLIYHEIGDETFEPNTGEGDRHPTVDPITGAYRPCAMALNYRSECFSVRLELLEAMEELDRTGSEFDESLAYSSYAFGDPATPMPRAYAGDPSKFATLHGGVEQFHSHHLHGGGIRWRFEPHADSHAQHNLINRGITKADGHRAANDLTSESRRLDAQSIGPGEGFTTEIACGAGGCQRAVGDLLFHCHVPEHYVAGMWGFWRTYNTLQTDLAELPERTGIEDEPVDSTGLLGTELPSGEVVTEDNVEAWVESNLPPQGVPTGYDATVYDWVKVDTPEGVLYLAEPEDDKTWANFDSSEHVEQLRSEGRLVEVDGVERRTLLFDPETGRLAWPSLSPHLGARPPYAPGAHGPSPYLSSPVNVTELPVNVDGPQSAPDDPRRAKDALCPPGSPVKQYNVIALEQAVQFNDRDGMPDAMIYVFADEAEAVKSGEVNPTPLVFRGNVGDCIHLTLVNELRDSDANHNFEKVNIHPHFLQFDVQGSDGVNSGYAYEQSIRPYRNENRALATDAVRGDRVLVLGPSTEELADKFAARNPTDGLQPGIWIGIGLGTDSLELHRIESVDSANGTITLEDPLVRDHDAGVGVGTEFVQYSYYLDANLGATYFHDHVNAILHWSRGLFGTLLIEPEGATFHDPTTGEEIVTGPVADIHTDQPEIAGEPGVSYREIILQFTDAPDRAPLGGDVAGTVNLRAESFENRLSDNDNPELVLSSTVHGDPSTTMLRAYEGDPVLVRVQNAGTWGRFPVRITGHDFDLEHMEGVTAQDSIQVDFAERYDLWLNGGAGDAGDYLWYNPQADHFTDGMWGIMRVHETLQPDLQPLPDRPTPPSGDGNPDVQPAPGSVEDRRPAAPPGLGTACPADAPVRNFAVEAIQVNVNVDDASGETRKVYVLADTPQSERESGELEPLVLRATAGECLEITLENRLDDPVSMHIGRAKADPQSSLGITVGYNPDQSVQPGDSRTFRVYAHEELTGIIADFAQMDKLVEGQRSGLYGALVVAPEDARFFDPDSGAEVSSGTRVVVVTPTETYRDNVLIFHEEDPLINGPIMPYYSKVKGETLVNYRSEPIDEGDRNKDLSTAFSSRIHGDPVTPLLEAYEDDPVVIRVIQGYGVQNSVFSLHGHAWPRDPGVDRSSIISVEKFWPHGVLNLELAGGANVPGDYLWVNHRMPYMEGGHWGLMRVHEPDAARGPLPLVEIEDIAAGGPRPATDDDRNATGEQESESAPAQSASGTDEGQKAVDRPDTNPVVDRGATARTASRNSPHWSAR